MVAEYLYKVGEIVNDTLIIIEQIRYEKDNNRKAYIVKSLIYPEAETYIATESNLKRGDKCKYKQGKAVCKGNSLYDLEYIRKYIIDIDDAKKITQNSRKKCKFKCPNCGFEKLMPVANLTNQGFKCNICSNKLSYPERFITAYLELKNIKYKYQHKEKSLQNRIFDFYLYELDIYLECHGIQHYDKNNIWYNHSVLQDMDKRRWGKENNKQLVELDCRFSEFDYIKNKVNESILPKIGNSDIKRIVEKIKNNETDNVKEVIELYKTCKSSYVVSEKLKINHKKVLMILKQNNVPIFSRIKKVKCLNTNHIFKSSQEAAEWCGVKNKDSIASCARGNSKYSGKHPVTGERLYWEYVEDSDFYFE